MAEKCCSSLSRKLGDCLKNGTVQVNGKWYCHLHDPGVALQKAQARFAERIAREQELEAEWKQKRAEQELADRRLRLIELVREADDDGGFVFIKPAGQKAKQCYCIPVARWMEIRELLKDVPTDPSPELVEINPYDREGIDE